jgi:hypothetical protein
VFTGTLSAQAQTSFQLRTGTGRDDAGDFGFPTGSIGTAFSQTPNVQFPLFPGGVGAEFRVFFDTDYPDPSTVKFTGPAGSNISSQSADAQDSDISDDNARYRIGKDNQTKIPGGLWTVLYKGQPRTFTLPPFNANASWVVILPTANVDVNGNLASVTWQYVRGNGSAFTSAPSFIAGVKVHIRLNDSGDSPRSGQLSPSVTTFDLAAAGFSTPEWNKVSGVEFQYSDFAGNLYEIKYGKTFSVQLNPRLENIYYQSGPGCNPSVPSTCLFSERLLNVFVDVPAGTVSTNGCPGSPNMPNQTGPPFIVQIQNHDTANGQPLPAGAVFASPTCLDRTGTTQFNGDGGLTDIFSLRQIITDADASYPPGLAVGAQYDISIDTPSGRQTIQTSLDTPEANPSTDFVVIPNPSTPLLKPAGFTLAQAKLGQAQTISWTQPAFEVRELFINPNVNTTTTGGGVFCSVQNNNDLDPSATQATFTLPTTCQGQAVLSASVCIFYTGVNGETSDACWFWQ